MKDPISGLVGLLFWAAVIYWFYHRRQKKRAQIEAEQRREAERLAAVTASPSPLPGYDAEGEELDAYVMNMLAERAKISCLKDFMPIRDKNIHRYGRNEKKCLRREFEIIRESCEIIEDTSKIQTAETRIQTIQTILERMQKEYAYPGVQEKLTLLHAYISQIHSAIYIRIIQESIEKALTLKTAGAQKKKYAALQDTVRELERLDYLPMEELAALRRFSDAHRI